MDRAHGVQRRAAHLLLRGDEQLGDLSLEVVPYLLVGIQLGTVPGQVLQLDLSLHLAPEASRLARRMIPRVVADHYERLAYVEGELLQDHTGRFYAREPAGTGSARASELPGPSSPSTAAPACGPLSSPEPATGKPSASIRKRGNRCRSHRFSSSVPA